MALEPIIDALTWLVAQAEPLAKVWPADRIAVEPEDAQAVFGCTDTAFTKGWSIRCWMLDRTSSSEEWSTNSESIRRHTLRLQGYREVNDSGASRVAFRLATEAICDALRSVPYMGAALLIPDLPDALQDAIPDVELLGPPNLSNDGLAVLGEVYVCHSVSITVVVQERLLHHP